MQLEKKKTKSLQKICISKKQKTIKLFTSKKENKIFTKIFKSKKNNKN